MALTLPYPNLDFVPLDVLTAEEMNEIVANYTYIANQFPISSANIATAGVTSNNIDWTTIGSSGKIDLGNILIQWDNLTTSSGNGSISFPTAFGSAPTVVITCDTTPSISTTMVGTKVANITTTKFDYGVTIPNGFGNPYKVNWIAIGPKA